MARRSTFEIETLSPGFAVYEDPECSGEVLHVSRMPTDLHDHLQQTLTPVVNRPTREQVEA